LYRCKDIQRTVVS